MVGEVHTDPTRRVEALHETPHLRHELVTRHGRHGGEGLTSRTSDESTCAETVGPVSWSVQPGKVITERTAWLTPVADTKSCAP